MKKVEIRMRKIEGYENYVISDAGEVLNTKTGIKLKQKKTKDGYKRVWLCKDGKTKGFLVHRLVGFAFIPNFLNKPHINHIDENKQNNNIDNLEWCTPKENNNHGTRTKRQAISVSGKNNYNSKQMEYYSTKSTKRNHFKTICKNQKWEFENFIEEYSGEKTYSNKKYYYLIKKGVVTHEQK